MRIEAYDFGAITIDGTTYTKDLKIPFKKIESALAVLNRKKWMGYDNWRTPTIEEILVLMVPEKNRYGLYLPGGWNCDAKDIWSCNAACDSVSTKWYWVARLAIGRCNYGHPDIRRSLLAVRSVRD